MSLGDISLGKSPGDYPYPQRENGNENISNAPPTVDRRHIT